MTEPGTESNLISITSALAIPASELQFQFSRSGGPGGQNVNKRETRVELLFDLRKSFSLNEEQRARLLQHLANQGILRIVADSQRSQLQNRQEALARFVQLLQRALYVPRRRRPTRPSRQTVEQRLNRKRQRAEAKERRRRVQQGE
jgi:ribosome-associated protein